MKILEHIPLAEFTTFKIGGPARYFCRVTSEEDLLSAVKFARNKKKAIFVLGGGSNLLISDSGFTGLVIKMEMKGVTFDGERVTAAAGELWDEVVDRTVERGLYGLENLSAIPGTVGAVPVQNIGAYGAEISQLVETVRAFDLRTLKFVNFTNIECGFAYRDSMFKQKKGRYVVTSVTSKLKKNGSVNITYKDLREYFEKKTRTKNNKSQKVRPTLREVRNAVIEIRWGKLPDWKLWGSAGSYFKNPTLSQKRFVDLKERYPELPGYPEPDGRIKVSLAWILDKVCNLKGLCIGNVCVYKKQTLVIVSQPGASAEEVVSLSREMSRRVKETTGINIEAEVEWVN